jgi:hypothetical protein
MGRLDTYTVYGTAWSAYKTTQTADFFQNQNVNDLGQHMHQHLQIPQIDHQAAACI